MRPSGVPARHLGHRFVRNQACAPAPVLALLAVAVLVLSGCIQLGTGNGDAPRFPTGPATGVTLSPRDHDAHFASFWDEADDLGRVVAWAGPLHTLMEPGGAATVTATQNARHGFLTALRTSPYSPDNGFPEPFDEEARQRYLDDLTAFVTRHPVAYLELGTEVDIMKREDPEGYTAFADWWTDAYRAVKDASPHTTVFVSYQYEHVIGRYGGLWGGNDTQPDWSPLFQFLGRDLTAFTTYPGMRYADPDDLPDDHYGLIAAGVSGPVAFTEVGHPAHLELADWASDPDEQARFITWFADHAPDARLVLWRHLYDQDAAPPFDAMGLRDDDGTPRPGLQVWRDAVRITDGTT